MAFKYKYPVMAALFTTAHFANSATYAEDKTPPKTHEEVVKEVEQVVEQTGVKVGMTKEKVMQLLGDKYTEVKVSKLADDEKVLIWQRDKDNSVTVTFIGDKVKAVAHSMSKPEQVEVEDEDS